jgi:hypothetical protein
MIPDRGPSEEFLARLDVVQNRLQGHAYALAPGGLTDPDPPTGEQWEWGQVWAHVAEFVPFWVRQVRQVLATESVEPLPFGRVKTDTARVAAIDQNRDRPAEAQMAELISQLDDLRALLRDMTPGDWQRTVRHVTLGVLDMPRVLNEFLVGHLEQHADQLDGLAGA